MNVQCPSCETVYRVDPAKVPAEGVRARCAVCSFAIALTPELPSEAPVSETRALEPVQETPVVEAEAIAEEYNEETTEVPFVENSVEPPAEASPGLALVPDEIHESPDEGGDTAVSDVIETPHDGASRLSRPFVAPQEPVTSAPEQPVTRPTAPVFKPTPGAPIQETPVAPVETPSEPEAVVDAEPAYETVVEPVSEPEVAPPLDTPPQPSKPINPFLQRDPKQKARRLARALISDMIVYQPQKRQDALDNGTLKEEFEEEIRKSWEEYVDQVGEEMAKGEDFFRSALNEILAGGQDMF